MPLTHETRSLLQSLRRRTAARLRRAALLLTLPEASVSPIDDSAGFDIQRWYEQPDLSTDMALRGLSYHTSTLPLDAWELLWSDVTDILVENHECDFDGLGRFRFDGDKGLVSFRADRALSQVTPLDVRGEESEWSSAIAAGAEAADIARQAIPLVAAPDAILSLASLFFSQSGPHAVRNAIARHTLEDDASNVAISAAAFMAYEVVLLSLGQQLRDGERVDIPLVGTFTTSMEVITFDASAELIDYLIANDRVSL